jgi:hypothetical protein
MSRYLVEGIKADLARGLRVGVVAHTMVGAREVFASVAEAMKNDAEKITRTNGNERVTSKEGGEFRVFSRHSKGMRGVSLDVLVIADRGAYTYEQYRDLMEEALPVMATSTNFELIPA